MSTLYCPNYSCKSDSHEINKLACDLWSVSYAVVAATFPVCPDCGEELTKEPPPLPGPFGKLLSFVG